MRPGKEGERQAKRELKEIGINWTVSLVHQQQAPSELIEVDNRHQPPVPINTSLQDLLEAVKTATDPWLLFLYVFQVVRLDLLMIL